MGSGTPVELQRDSGLSAFVLSGEGAAGLAHEIERRPGVSTVTRLGADLRVTGDDRTALVQALAPYRDRLQVEPAEPSLEEVFIHLSRRATDNMG